MQTNNKMAAVSYTHPDVYKRQAPRYWQSYSDMMAALLLLFVLIIAITLGIYKMKTTDLEQAELQLNNTRTCLLYTSRCV